MNNKQFTIKKEVPESYPNCSIVKINESYLQFNNTINYTHTKNNDLSLYLLGNLFDYKNVKASNQDLLDVLVNQSNKEDFFKILDHYYGEYVIIYVKKDEFIILNDCCAQKEIYYTDDYTELGSQPQLLSHNTNTEENHPYYTSTLFTQKKLYIGTSTSISCIKHLAPNHYIDLLHKKVVRFFPTTKIFLLDIDEVAKKAAIMLKGYISAIAHRHKIILPVTGGFDSRLLFLASLDLECEYFVSQHNNMGY